jgi:hypothetical protein
MKGEAAAMNRRPLAAIFRNIAWKFVPCVRGKYSHAENISRADMAFVFA